MGGWMDVCFHVGLRHRNLYASYRLCSPSAQGDVTPASPFPDGISTLEGRDVSRSLKAVLVSHVPDSSSFRTHLSVQWPSLASSAHQPIIHIHVSICAT
jgi:hypothetical protein